MEEIEKHGAYPTTDKFNDLKIIQLSKCLL
jgi:hypothetical protein